MKPTERTVRNLLFALLIVAVLSPMIPGVPFVFTANFLKATVFQIAVEMAFVLWVYLAVKHREFRPNVSHPLVLSLILFALALCVTVPFSVNPAFSFWSSAQRVMGMFQYLHLVAFFLILAGTVREWKEWKMIFVLSTIAACVGDVVALYQWWTDSSGLLRVPGAFANTLFLAQYVTLHIGIAALLWAKADMRWERPVYTGVFLLHIFALVITASRGSMLGIAVAIIVAAVAASLRAKRTLMRIGVPLAVLLAMVLGASALVFVHAKGYVWAYDHLPFAAARIAYPNAALNDGQSILEIQAADRDNTWRMGVEGFLERPITGWGFESFRVYFDRHFDPLGRDADMIESGFDRLHNQYIEMLFATGLLGFVPYMLFWISAFWIAYKRYRNEDAYWHKFALLFVLMLVVAHFVQIFFLFDARGGAEVFLVIAAFLYAETREKSLFRAPCLPRFRRAEVIAVPLAILVIPLVYWGNVLPMTQMYKNAVGLRLLATDVPAATDAFEDSFSPKTYVTYWLRLSPLNAIRVTIDLLGVRTQSFERLVALNVRESDRSAEEFPEEFGAAHSAAIAHRQAARYFPENAAWHTERGEEMTQRMLEQGPGHVETYEELGEIALIRGDFDAAIMRFEESKERVLWSEPLMGRFDFRIAEAHARAGDFQAAMDALDVSYGLGYGVFYDYRLLEAIVSNFPEDPSVIPDGLNFYAAQFFTVQKERFNMVLLTARYFALTGDEESHRLTVDRLFELDAERAVDFFPKEE